MSEFFSTAIKAVKKIASQRNNLTSKNLAIFEYHGPNNMGREIPWRKKKI